MAGRRAGWQRTGGPPPLCLQAQLFAAARLPRQGCLWPPDVHRASHAPPPACRHGYFAALPPREYLPLFWSDAQLRLLAGTELEGSAESDRSACARVWVCACVCVCRGSMAAAAAAAPLPACPRLGCPIHPQPARCPPAARLPRTLPPHALADAPPTQALLVHTQAHSSRMFTAGKPPPKTLKSMCCPCCTSTRAACAPPPAP